MNSATRAIIAPATRAGLVFRSVCGNHAAMPPVAQVAIHPSQFPDQIRRDLIDSLRSRRVNHKFHYDSVKQTQQWLALHDAFSPARTDADCLATYDAAFVSTASQVDSSRVHVIGLGCGGGQKDTRLLQLLRQAGRQIAYTPSDVSVAMVLTARATVLTALPALDCHPLVCDLATADDLPEVLATSIHPEAARLITFFGMIPNFEPDIILPRLAALLRPDDLLLFSANLAPGPDYTAGVQRVLPLYDNDLTREWLLTFLFDLAVERADGALAFAIEDAPGGLKRIVADFKFIRARRIQIERDTFDFRPGDAIRLFFSYRHTPALVRTLLVGQDLEVRDQWTAKSGEEGVFLCRRK